MQALHHITEDIFTATDCSHLIPGISSASVKPNNNRREEKSLQSGEKRGDNGEIVPTKVSWGLCCEDSSQAFLLLGFVQDAAGFCFDYIYIHLLLHLQQL